MDADIKAGILAAVEGYVACRLRLVAAQNADAVARTPSPYMREIAREEEEAASRLMVIGKLLDQV